MTYADKLLVAVLKHSDENIFVKINKRWLDSTEYKKYLWIKDYLVEHEELPGAKSFCAEFSLDITEVDSRPALYLKNVKDRYIANALSDALPPLLKKIKGDPGGVLTEVKDFITSFEVDATKTRDTMYSDAATLRIKAYDERRLTKGVVGLSTGVDVLDSYFYGYRETDLITVGGRAGSKKTWLLCFLAYKAEQALRASGSEEKIMFVTNEMSSEEVIERMDCIGAKLDYELMQKGSLSRKKFKEYKDYLSEIEHNPRNIIFVENCYYLDELNTKMALYTPRAVFLDGSYLMEPDLDEGWQKITTITRGLKRSTKTHRIPIVNTTQMKRATGKSSKSTSFDAQDDFAFSNSYTQDSDIAFRMYADADMMLHDEIGMQVAKGRRMKGETNLLFICPLTSMEIKFRLDEPLGPGIGEDDEPLAF